MDSSARRRPYYRRGGRVVSAVKANAHRDIRGLQPGERLEDQVYRIAQKELRTTSNGSLYIHAVLADATGQILGRMLNASQETYDTIPEGGFLHFRGRVESYRGKPQFIIDGVREVDQSNFDPSAFLPTTQYNIDDMWAETLEILRTVKQRDLLAVIGQFINDEQFTSEFRRAPAACLT